MYQDEFRAPPAMVRFELTYSPAHRASGSPLNPHASRQVLAERITTTVEAIHADAAVMRFEREHGLMVTACTRLQEAWE